MITLNPLERSLTVNYSLKQLLSLQAVNLAVKLNREQIRVMFRASF